MNFPITLLGGISCYALTREMGFSQKDAIWAPALICFSPVIYFHLKSQYLTNALFAFSSASALFICRFLKSGLLSEGLMSLISAGILLGIQYNGVPTVLVVFIVFSMKVIRVVKYAPLFKRLILIFLGLSIILVFGGRQYIHNTIDAHNPFYPFSIKIFERELFEGWPRLREIDTRISTWEKEKGYDKFTWWEIEYRKFLYLPSTAGPQFFPFFILAVLSLFVRPRDVPKNLWYCLACMWILPLIVFYTNSSTSFTRRGPFIDGSVRFIVASFALFSIQALVLIHTWKHHFKPTEILLSAFMAWHILRIYERQVWEIEVTYPVLIVLLVGLIVFYEIGIRQVKRFETASTELPRLTKVLNRRVLTMLFSSILLFVSFYFLQVYKDTTRYAFYREHFKNRLPGKFIDAWEFLDKPNEKKTIAMAMDFSSDNWFFYPLFGRQLQNDITYISSKHKWEVPTWFDSGIVSGNNFTIWWYNLEKNNVDYIFAAEPLPSNELKWINQQNKSFQLVFLDDHSKIFRFLKEEK